MFSRLGSEQCHAACARVFIWLFGFACLLSSPCIAADPKPLVVLGDSHLPPYEFIEDGKPRGIDIDLWQAIGKRLGRPVEVRLMPWSEAQAAFQAGQGDALTSISQTPERESIYDFTQTVHRYTFSLFVRTDDLAEFDRVPLASRRLGVASGSYPHAYFRNRQPSEHIVVVPDTGEGFRRLIRRDIDAFAVNTLTGHHFLRELGIRGIAPMPTPFAELKGGIAVREGDRRLQADLDRAIGDLKSDGTLDQIMDRWSGQRVHVFSHQEVLSYVGLALVALLFVVISAMLWATMRRHQDLVRGFNAFFENQGVGAVELDARTGRFSRVNQHFCGLTGYDAEELGRMSPLDLLHPDDLPGVRHMLPAFLKGEVSTFENEQRYIRKDGQSIWVHVTAALVKDRKGRPDHTVSLVRDITDRRRMEDELQRLNAELEDRIEIRTAELQAANQELEAISFATSHDLRGPLGRISSFSQLLEHEYRQRLEGNGLLYLDFIRQNALRLTQLVDDLLEHARVARQGLELKPVDLSALVAEVVAEKRLECKDGKTEIRVELPAATVIGEPHALMQSVKNLLENAIKYSANAASPVVEVGGVQEGTVFRLWVKDNGIGFDMAYHDRIFEMFKRLHTYTEYGGTGIGLALVKRAMERMKGRTWAESRPGEGATFFLELPTESAGGGGAARETGSASPPS